MSIAENSLGLSTVADLIDWTTSYLHFKHVLEQVPLQPEEAQIYLEAFTPFRERFAREMSKGPSSRLDCRRRCATTSRQTSQIWCESASYWADRAAFRTAR